MRENLNHNLDRLIVLFHHFNLGLTCIPKDPDTSFKPYSIHDLKIRIRKSFTNLLGSPTKDHSFSKDNNSRFVQGDVFQKVASEAGASSSSHIPHKDLH
ncbi:hypothetical protein ACH5RR_026463 [Cinchona calisaya]|uniref:Uncharacterized protein n=1 Tax=Cinchona calisaya TaxID=153742 RepID=A0ABD2Z4I6_9GENT